MVIRGPEGFVVVVVLVHGDWIHPRRVVYVALSAKMPEKRVVSPE